MKPRMPGLQLSRLPGAEVFPLRIPGHNRICNPSIAISDRGIFCIIREVNYDLNPSGHIENIPEGGYRSWNWIVELDENFCVIRIDRIDDGRADVDCHSVNRLEDCRVFRWRDAWWFTATWVLEDDPLLCQIALCRLEGSKIVEWHFLPSPMNAPREKNWMPRVDGDCLQWIYWVDPLEVVCRSGGTLSHERLGWFGRLEKWAGSSALMRYRGNWLCVVHLRKQTRHTSLFEHRLVELDDAFTLRRMSRPFTFEGEQVEYCAGLCLTRTHAILSYGVWDRKARFMRVELPAVEAMLKPLRFPRSVSVFFQDMRRAARPWIRQPRKTLVAVVRRRVAAK